MTKKSSEDKANPDKSRLTTDKQIAHKLNVMTGKTQGTPQQKRDTRFKKGQSGNPNGRPKKKANQATQSADETLLDAFILDFANRELTLMSGERKVSMNGLEAIIHAQAKSAMGGNAHAQKDILNRMDRSLEKQRIRQLERAEGWRAYKKRVSELLNEQRANDPDFDEDSQLPHPDDITISHDNTVTFSGPMDIEQLEQCNEVVELRDVLILQAELDGWDNELKDNQFTSNDPNGLAVQIGQHTNGAYLLAHLLDQALPQRKRLTEMEWIFAMQAADQLTRRELLRELYRRWNALKRNKSIHLLRGRNGTILRGMRFPGMSSVIRLYSDVTDYCNELKQSLDANANGTSTIHTSQEETEELADIIAEFMTSFHEAQTAAKT